MPVLIITGILTLILGGLIALSVNARSGLRGHQAVFWSGLFLGLLGGAIFWFVRPDQGQVLLLVDSLPMQIISIAGIKAVVSGMVLALILSILMLKGSWARRRGDLIIGAAGAGFGFGVATTLLVLLFKASWPPLALILALTNLPTQICVALLIGSAFLATRDGQARPTSRALLRHSAAVLLEMIYLVIIEATIQVGHWLAWLEPIFIGVLWLSLIGFFWLLGLSVMWAQRAADQPSVYIVDKPRFMLRPGLWYTLAGVILLPTLSLMVFNFNTDLGASSGKVMIYVLLSVPVLAASIMLRTGAALKKAA